MSRRPRWGIVGTGRISATTVGDLHRTENVDLVAVASRTGANAEAFAADHSVPRAYGDYDALFADEDVDVVYLGTPISTHAELARRAIEAGKHVLVEKAFTTTAAEARELAALAAERGRFLMEAMWMVFNPAIRRLLDEVAAGAIGELRTVQGSFGFPSPPDAIIWRPDLGGGALLDRGVYPLTLAQVLLGKPESVQAMGEMRDDGLDVTVSVYLRYSDGRFANALTSVADFVGAGANVGGTRGIVTLDPPFHMTETFSVVEPPFGTPRTVTAPREGNGYVPMFRAVSQAIGEGLLEHPWRPLRDTIEVLETMDEIRRQLAAGRGDPAQ
jgi:predicted dehydrogenase